MNDNLYLLFSMSGKTEGFKLKTGKSSGEEVGRERETSTVAEFNQNQANRGELIQLPEPRQATLEHDKNRVKQESENMYCLKSPSFLLLLSVVVFLLLVALEVALLLLQYISQKLSLNIFCALISLALFIHILVVLTLYRVKEKSFTSNNTEKEQPQSKVQSPAPRTPPPAIVDTKRPRSIKVHSKTRKLSYPAAFPDAHQNEGKTIKQIKMKKKMGKSQIYEVTDGQTPNLQAKMFLGTTVIENSYQGILSVVCLSSIQNPTIYGFSYITGLLTTALLLILTSFLLVIAIYSLLASAKVTEENNVEEMVKENNEQIVKEGDSEEARPTFIVVSTKLNLQQRTQTQVQEEERRSTEESKVREVEIGKSELESLPLEIEKGAQELLKVKKDRSVLKKVISCKYDQCLGQVGKDGKDTRNVQINFKNNQIFEYDKSSVHSSDCHRQTHKKKSVYFKSKYGSPHNNICDREGASKNGEKERRRCKSVQKGVQAAKIIEAMHSKFKELYE